MKKFKILAVCKSEFKYVKQRKQVPYSIKANDFHEAVEKIKKFFKGEEYAKRNTFYFENITNK